MTSTHENDARQDRPPNATDDTPSETTPTWAPVTALPSSEVLLAFFAGLRPLQGSYIVHAAVNLVACQQQYRQALLTLTGEQIGHQELKQASSDLVSAREAIETLIAVVDDTVDNRQQQRAIAPPSAPPPVPITGVPEGTRVMVVQTESIGALVARMADLWGLVLAAVATDEEPPEATRLAQLCEGYDCLVAAIESGQQLVLGR
ncbi:hypothetical protein [Nocardia sp. NBC_00403]|uniref:hypothetical protein n=1 Tax=Nocardia sp. NBC_00403 TaxID=2975990 RepID=UPI002E20D7DD